MSQLFLSKIRTSAVFPLGQLDAGEQCYLLAAASDPDCGMVAKLGSRFLVCLSAEPAQNSVLHGMPGLSAMLYDAQRSGCRYIEIDPDITERQAETYRLPYGIEVQCDAGGGSLSSSLAQEFIDESEPDDTGLEIARGEAAADAIESLILAMASEGYDVSSGAFVRALDTSVHQIAEHF
jgi:hypothetical protein